MQLHQTCEIKSLVWQLSSYSSTHEGNPQIERQRLMLLGFTRILAVGFERSRANSEDPNEILLALSNPGEG